MNRVRNRIVPVAAMVSMLLLGAFGFALVRADRSQRDDAQQRFSDRAQISASLISGTLTSFLPQLVEDARLSYGGPLVTKRDLRSGDFADDAEESDTWGGGGTIVIDAGSRRVLGSIGSIRQPRSSRLAPVPDHVRTALEGEAQVSSVIVNESDPDSPGAVELAVPFDTNFGPRVAINRFELNLLVAFFGGPLAEVPDIGEGVLSVIDENGRIVVSNDGEATATLADPALTEVADIRKPTEVELGDETQLVTAVPMEAAEWTLVASAPTSALYNETSLLGTPLPWLIFFALTLAAGGVTVLLRKVVQDSERIDKAYVALEHRNAEVERATRAKSEFLANMSHELRTPLNGIIGFSELLHDGKLGPITDDQREYLGDVLSSAEHLRELIESLLDLSKIEAGKMEFHPEPTDVAEMAEQVAGALSSLAARKEIDVTVVPAPDLGPVEIDPGKLRQVFYNYISNAIKYTDDGGWVKISLEPAGGDRFRIVVEDNGIGIRAEDVGRLFNEFEQLDAGASKSVQGTGLGLALTKRIVEAQGGTVGVSSTFGQGSRFEATLPRVSAPVIEPVGGSRG